MLRLHRENLQKGAYGSEGMLEVIEGTRPPMTLERDFRADGRVLAPDGSGVAGAIVAINDFPFRELAPVWTFSDDHGVFHLSYRAAKCFDPFISYGQSGFFSHSWSKNDDPCETRWKNARDIVMPSASHLILKPIGVDPLSVKAYWWDESFGWRAFSSLHPWVCLSGYERLLVKLESAGFLPVIQDLQLPRVFDKNDKLPVEVSEEFHFERASPIELVLRGGGKPISGAVVDIDWIEDLAKDTHRALTTVVTGADGRIRLKGRADQLVEAFVYRGGFEPARAIVTPDRSFTLTLSPRNADLWFAPSASAVLARIRDVRYPQAPRTLHLDPGRATQVKVAQGNYDVLIYGNRGNILSYQRIAVHGAEILQIDAAIDLRPRLTVRYADEGWRVSITDAVPRGIATGWVAMILPTGALTIADVPAVLERQSPAWQRILLRLEWRA